jgi:GntR family transcriptional regulator, transcriptional repressor for pyruvate dehydrogenase complex
VNQVQFEPIKPVRAYERVVEQVEMAILGGKARPGEHLPSERELMAQFAVSRSTVREALRVLESHGLVQSRPGDPNGPTVLPISSVPLHKSMTRLASTQSLTLVELLQFRILLEGASAFLAAEQRTNEQLAKMESALEAMRDSADQTLFSQADLAFHEAMAEASQNTLVKICAQVVRGVTLDLITGKVARSEAPDDLMQSWIQRHTSVLDAIREKDGLTAASLMRRDLYDYYAPYVTEEEQQRLQRLIEGAGPATDLLSTTT